MIISTELALFERQRKGLELDKDELYEISVFEKEKNGELSEDEAR
jgi:hypothetical protein